VSEANTATEGSAPRASAVLRDSGAVAESGGVRASEASAVHENTANEQRE
jgi:hypothetical protein